MFSLLLNLKATYFRLFEWMIVVFKYYRNLSFLFLELLLKGQYLFKSPHRISKNFLRKRGESQIYGYGETPLTSLDKIARKCQILSEDRVYDLGCGPGRTSFWLHSFIGCKVIAIDYLPEFIAKARRVQKLGKVGEIEFQCKDMCSICFKDATVVYLYGTCLEEDMIKKLSDNFLLMSPKAKIITVSYPLSLYSEKFKIEKQFPVRFPWGKADVFLNRHTTS